MYHIFSRVFNIFFIMSSQLSSLSSKHSTYAKMKTSVVTLLALASAAALVQAAPRKLHIHCLYELIYFGRLSDAFERRYLCTNTRCS